MKNNGFYVILDENIDVRMAKSSLLQTMAFKAGYSWGGKVKEVGHTKSRMIGFGTWGIGDLTHQPEAKPKMGENGEAKLVSFEEALRRLSEEAKPEFKIGDWVRRKEGYTDYPGRAFEIDEFNNRENSEKRGIYYPGEPKEWDYTHTFRYATKTEISDAEEKINKLIIAAYDVKFGSDITGIGCEEHYNVNWIDLLKIMETFNIKLVEHKSGPIVDITEIEALVKRLKI